MTTDTPLSMNRDESTLLLVRIQFSQQGTETSSYMGLAKTQSVFLMPFLTQRRNDAERLSIHVHALHAFASPRDAPGCNRTAGFLRLFSAPIRAVRGQLRSLLLLTTGTRGGRGRPGLGLDSLCSVVVFEPDHLVTAMPR